MSTEFIKPAVFEKYGTSLYVGIGIPIPVLDEDLMINLSVENKDIFTNIIDYSVPHRSRPSLGKVSYAELRSGTVTLEGKKIPTAPLSSLSKARQIAQILKSWIQNNEFTLQEPIKAFDKVAKLKTLEEIK